ncbi:MAG: queuosine precursor transporter [Candidatus Kerfeldbacteria bacterium]|nr:queuosine precursor transporter [Candidatus Kerfeldbacteria bacterium]
MPFRLITLITGLFVAVLLISNIVSTKIVSFGSFTFDGGTLLFPLAYIFGDILTEVYGYTAARRVIWIGFTSAVLMSVMIMLIDWLPAAPDWPYQDAYHTILGLTPRIVLGSLTAYWAGEFLNSYVLAKMKIATHGRWLWARTIGSTIVGEGVDTALFILIAFWGVLPTSLIVSVLISNYIFKVGVEVLMTPVTYTIVRFLKRRERIDVYDTNTNFNPFVITDRP